MKKQRLAWVLTAAMLAVSIVPAGTAAAESVTESAESAVTELEDGIRLAYEDFLTNPMRAER